MKIRIAVLMAALVASGVVLPAQAAPRPKPKPKPTCNLVVDAPNDTTYNGVALEIAALDVTSADLSSDKTRLAATIRVRDIDAQDHGMAFAKHYFFTWQAPGGKVRIGLSAVRSVNGVDSFSFGTATNPWTFSPQGTASGGVFDVAKNEIRIWTNVSDYTKLKDVGNVKAGAKQNTFRAETKFGQLSWNLDFGTADPKTTYPVGYPSCAPVGS